MPCAAKQETGAAEVAELEAKVASLEKRLAKAEDAVRRLQAELEETLDLSVRLRDRITEMQIGIARGLARLEQLQHAIDAGGRGASGAAREKEVLEGVLSELYKHGERGDHAHLHPELTTDYARIYTMISNSDHRPPASAYPRLEELEVEFVELMAQLRAILERPIT